MMPLYPVQICHSSTGVLTGARREQLVCSCGQTETESAASWLRSVSGKVRQFTPSCRRLQQPIKVAKRHCDEVIQVKLHHKIRHPLFRFPFVRHLPLQRGSTHQPRCRRRRLMARSLRPLHTRRCLGPRVACRPDRRRLGPSPPSLRDALRPRDPATQPTSRLPCSAELATHRASTHTPAP